MNRKVIAGVLIGVIVLGIGAYLFKTFKNSPNPVQGPTRTYEPPFRADGTLAFYDRATRDTVSVLQIEIAESDQAITAGLMYRRQMDEDRGMLFIFPEVEMRSFWMKNTYLPLDMIFVDETQRIVTIQANTTPLTTTSVPSSKPAKYVIEVNAGYCVRHGIEEGDFVTFQRGIGA